MYRQRTKGYDMRTSTEPALVIWGIEMGEDRHYLQINKQELATLKRAAAIREEARDRISNALGLHSFEISDHYLLTIDDLIDHNPSWDNLDIDLANDSECSTCVSGGHLGVTA